MVWLEQLPDAVAAVRDAWSLALGAPFEQRWRLLGRTVTRADGSGPC